MSIDTLPEGDIGTVTPMIGVPFAIRIANGGPLRTDGPAQRAAFAAGCEREELRMRQIRDRLRVG